MSNELVIQKPSIPAVSFSEKERLAEVVAESKIFGITTPAQALTLMALCESEGLHPMQAVRRFHLINGKASMRADAMLAEFQSRGGRVSWGERTNASVSGTFSHPAGGEITVTWTLKDAQEAALTGNPTWKKFPRQMLTARVISEAIRTILPGVVAGIYTPEEIDDIPVIEGQIVQPQPPPRAIPAKPVATTQAFNNVAPAQAKTPAPPPDWDPRAEFVKLAIEKGFDVLNAEGVPSGAKCREVLYTIYGTTTVEMPTTKDLWDAARKTLEVYQAPATGPAMGNTPDGEDDLEDPFKD